jgi:hypothetical protein
LRHRSIGQLFVVAKQSDGILQIRSVELVRHGNILYLARRMSTANRESSPVLEDWRARVPAFAAAKNKA